MSRLGIRSGIVLQALRRRGWRMRRPPSHPRRILLVHQLLLGDTLMTSPLLAKLRQRFPEADIAMAMPPAFLPLYAKRPWQVQPLPLSMHNRASVHELMAGDDWDWVLLPGDNRFSWLAQAVGARWISGWENDLPDYKNWLVDELRPWPVQAAALGDLWSDLVDGPPPRAFKATDWPMPTCDAYARPTQPYAVLHVGASNPRKFWPPMHWKALAEGLEREGLTIVFSAGKGEEHLVEKCDPEGRYRSLAGQLDLSQLGRLLQEAALLVAPDTGVAHLGKVTATPTVALFGQGPTQIYGRGAFWADMPFTAAVLEELPARPQKTLFRRAFPWLSVASAVRNECPDIQYGSGTRFVLDLALQAMRRDG